MLTLLLATTTNADALQHYDGAVCFDLESGKHGGWPWSDDEVHEDSSCTFEIAVIRPNGCGIWEKIASGSERHIGNYLTMDCIKWTERGGTVTSNMNHRVVIQTNCDDALWADRFLVSYKEKFGSWLWWPKIERWGVDNSHGWCLSTDRNDHRFGGKRQHVLAGRCYRAVQLRTNGGVYAYSSSIINDYPWASNNYWRGCSGRRLADEDNTDSLPAPVQQKEDAEECFETEDGELDCGTQLLSTSSDTRKEMAWFHELSGKQQKKVQALVSKLYRKKVQHSAAVSRLLKLHAIKNEEQAEDILTYFAELKELSTANFLKADIKSRLETASSSSSSEDD